MGEAGPVCHLSWWEERKVKGGSHEWGLQKSKWGVLLAEQWSASAHCSTQGLEPESELVGDRGQGFPLTSHHQGSAVSIH